MAVTKKLDVRLGGSATLAASSQDEDRWRAAQEGGHSGVGGVAGHPSAIAQGRLSRKNARSGAPPVISGNVKDKPASYFVVKVAPPAGSPPGAASQACEAVRSMSVIGILQQKTTTEILSLAMKIVFRR